MCACVCARVCSVCVYTVCVSAGVTETDRHSTLSESVSDGVSGSVTRH